MSKETAKKAELPNGWLWVKLNDFCDIILGQSPPSSTYNEKREGLPFYQGKTDFQEVYPIPRKWCNSPKKVAEQGDILISVRAPVGPTNICPEKSCIGRGLAALRGKDEIKPLFLLYLMRTFEENLAGKGYGSTFSAITGKDLRNFYFPLPPLPEQHRIVDKIEELFTKLDSGVEALERVRKLLGQYRRSVLKAAFEGELTRNWREAELADPDSELQKESAGKLLEKIGTERKKRGKKLKDTPPVDTSELSELPDGWVWGHLEDVLDYIQPTKYIVKSTEYKDNYPTPVLTAGKSFVKGYTNEKDNIFNELPVIIFDDFTTATQFVDFPFKVKSSAMKILMPTTDLVNLKFVFYFMQTIRENTDTHKRYWISIFSKLPIKIPSLTEQHQIVQEIERRLSIADHVEQSIEEGIKKSDALRHSILKKAFEGKLVPQDPSDEPADKLLERIKADKVDVNRQSVGSGT